MPLGLELPCGPCPRASPAPEGYQQLISNPKLGFPKIRATFLGVPIIRIIVYWGVKWGPHVLGNYQTVVSIFFSVI